MQAMPAIKYRASSSSPEPADLCACSMPTSTKCLQRYQASPIPRCDGFAAGHIWPKSVLDASVADHIFSLSPGDLVVFGDCRERVGHRFLGGFVPLKTQMLKDLASAQTVRFLPDDLQ